MLEQVVLWPSVYFRFRLILVARQNYARQKITSEIKLKVDKIRWALSF